MISQFHFWKHTYLLSSEFQEYWECTRCGYRIQPTVPASFREGNTFYEKIPAPILAKIEEANKLGCPYFLVHGIMES
jgi:hypothetical protein